MRSAVACPTLRNPGERASITRSSIGSEPIRAVREGRLVDQPVAYFVHPEAT